MRRLLILLLLLALPLAAQDRRKEALQLFEDDHFVEALPLFEELARQSPEDGAIQMRLGFCRLVHANTLWGDKRKAERARAREALEKAQKLGVSDSMLTAALESLSDTEIKFSDNPRADEIMYRAEAAFAREDYAGACTLYQEALRHDPALYDAALFAGQCCRIQKDFPSAEAWYQKAIAIDPEREAAYRYWGNSLLARGQKSLALDKYIEAYLRQPYARESRNGLVDYSKSEGLTLAHPHIRIPARVEGSNIQITQDAGAAWLTYALSRMLWRSEGWGKAHPGEPYRPSLEEEALAFRSALQVAEESQTPRDASLQTLQKLDKAGLLEAFILLGMADEGIVDDYPAYCKSHRDLLERYVREVVLQGGKV